MPDVVGGYTLSFFDEQGKQNVLSGTSTREGVVRALVCTDDEGVYLGGPSLDWESLPNTGFLMTPGVEYQFDLLAAELYVATTSTTSVKVRALVMPRL